MFIQKDLRKIPRILADAAPLDNADKDNGEEPETKRMKRNVLTELRLSRRNSEFNGSLKILCQPQNAPSLQHLVSLSLYNCQIQSLEGIGMLASSEIEKNSGKCNVVCCSPMLRELNVGRNPITFLPDELALLPLKELWMDDCQLTGPLPDCITRMKDLEILRVSNNKITHIPSSIQKLRELKTLCLDRNEIETVPEELSRLHYLETLLLRYVPSGVCVYLLLCTPCI
jgi:Leucine-rich repeat (LRR) protein